MLVRIAFFLQHEKGIDRIIIKFGRAILILFEFIEVADRTKFGAALSQVDDSIDALWSVPDSVVLSRRLAQRVLLHTIRKKIPMMGLSEQYVQAGALFALVTSYHANGEQAAQQVRRVLSGEDPARIAVATPSELEIVFNARTADSIDVRLATKRSMLAVRPVR